jgi:DegV family protein with EDD domain
MPGVHIVTDSSSDLTPGDIEGLDVAVVPLTIRFGDEEFLDRTELSVDDFYKRMAAADELPQTACPAPGAFERAFRQAEEAGAGAVVCIALSGSLSNTVQSAQTAADHGFGIPVHVVDSRSVSSGLGTMVLDAASHAATDLESVLARVTGLVARTHVSATLNTLDNLKKGGRIGGARAMLGSVLAIKPIIDLTGGVVEEAGKARTRRRALQGLADRLTGAGEIGQVAVMHGGAPDLDDFLELIADRFPRSSLRIGELGAVIGAHGGAEIVGVSWVAAA